MEETLRDPRRDEVASAPLELDRALNEAPYEQRYELGEVLGTGGMGEVRIVADTRIGRQIAQKVLREEVRESRHNVERFVREARVQGQLEHPAVVPVYDLGIDPEGHAYFTMKRVIGTPLDQILLARADEPGAQTSGGYSRRRLLSAFVQVCLAVDYAHSRGVLHRDLKPANIMLGHFGEVHVLDWGLAKVMKARDSFVPDEPVTLSAEPNQTPTLVGAVLGTPGYLSPEQARGESSTLDARTDVYALGAVLFEIVYREPLITGSTMSRLSSTMIGIRSFASRKNAAEVPPELEALCLRACALNRDERYPSARQLADAVERWLDGERDEEKRRELSMAHVSRAKELRAKVGGIDLDARREALRELGRALVLEPTHEGALTELDSLLRDVPREHPVELQAEIEQASIEQRRDVFRSAALRHAVWVAVGLGCLATMEVRAPLLGYVIALTLSVLSLLSFYVWKRAPRSNTGWWLVIIGSGATLGVLSIVFGPLVVLPSLAGSSAVLFSPQTSRLQRTTLHATLLLALALPVVLGELGVVPRTYAFSETGMIELVSPLLVVSGHAMLWLVTLVHVSAVILPGKLSGRFFDRMRDAETELVVRSWYLRQLLPRGAARDGARS